MAATPSGSPLTALAFWDGTADRDQRTRRRWRIRLRRLLEMPSSTLADFIHAFRAVRIVSVDLYADELRNEGIGADYEVAPPFVARRADKSLLGCWQGEIEDGLTGDPTIGNVTIHEPGQGAGEK